MDVKPIRRKRVEDLGRLAVYLEQLMNADIFETINYMNDDKFLSVYMNEDKIFEIYQQLTFIHRKLVDLHEIARWGDED